MKAVVAMLLIVSLSGCAGSASDGATGSAVATVPPELSSRDGRLDVYVLDASLIPLEGATVSLNTNHSTSTDATGLALFEAVPAGTVLITAQLDGYRTATSAAIIEADTRTQTNLKLLASAEPGDAGFVDEPFQRQFQFNGFFDCSATYVIITGDCMLLLDNVTGQAGLGTPAGDQTQEEFTMDFPLDFGWESVVGEMFWEANGPATGAEMTFALEPTEYDTGEHAPKYARSEGGSPLRWLIHAGEPHESATASADGDEPDMPNAFGGEIVRTRSYVAGQILHRPAGTGYLGIGAAISQEFEVIVTVFYGEPAPEDFSVQG